MRPSRKFRPTALAPMEDRVVLSHLSLTGHHHSHPKTPAATATAQGAPGLKNAIPTPANVLAGSVGDFHGKNIAQTVQAGNPVYEEITTNFVDPAAKTVTAADTQTENRLVTPDKPNNTVTTARNINLRNNAGAERVVDVAVTTGDTTDHTVTTTLPGGATETETETEVVQGGKTLMKGTITLPGGSTRTYTGTTSSSGNKTTTDKTIVDPEGFTTKVHTVVTAKDELHQSTVTTTAYPDGTTTTSSSSTFVLRLQPPTS